MDKELRMILAKYFIIVTLVIFYVAFMIAFVGPAINHIAFGQSAFDTPNQFNNPNQFNQFGQQQQFQQPYDPYGQQQFQQPYDPYGQQFQQPYGQQPYYGMQQQPVSQNPIQFGTSEIIYTLLGGGALGYARYNQHKRNQDKEVQKDLMAAILQEKVEKRELARVSYQHMPKQGNEIQDAPSIQLQKLDKDIDAFTDKVAKV